MTLAGAAGPGATAAFSLLPPVIPTPLNALSTMPLNYYYYYIIIFPAAALFPSLVLLAHALPGVELPAIIHDETEVAHHVVQRPVRGQPVPNAVDAEGGRHIP